MTSWGAWFRKLNPITTHAVKPPPDPDSALLKKLAEIGMLYPVETLAASRSTGLDLAIGCSVLTQESGGGENIFGHDPTIFSGAGAVTRDSYAKYKAARIASGNRLMQGVGPMQLTYFSYQDEADALGGCWVPRYNIRQGFKILAANIAKYGVNGGVAAYNGSGPAAVTYSKIVVARAGGYRASLA